MQLTTADGVSLHFEVQGPSDGPAVLFANSPGTHLGLWDGIVELMPQGYRLVRMDKRGHGLSTCPPGPYSIAGLADDCSTILDHLGIRRSVFVGLSIGGLIGQQLALTRPGLVRALVLANSGVRIGNRAMWRERIGLARAGKLGDMADAVIKRWFSARFRSCHPGRVEAWRTDLVRVPGEGYAGCCEAIMGADFSESAGWILQPTLVIAGSEDEATPVRLAEQATSLIPESRLAVIEGAGTCHASIRPRHLLHISGKSCKWSRRPGPTERIRLIFGSGWEEWSVNEVGCRNEEPRDESSTVP